MSNDEKIAVALDPITRQLIAWSLAIAHDLDDDRTALAMADDLPNDARRAALVARLAGFRARLLDIAGKQAVAALAADGVDLVFVDGDGDERPLRVKRAPNACATPTRLLYVAHRSGSYASEAARCRLWRWSEKSSSISG